MYLVIERKTGNVIARKNTETEAYREKSIIEGKDIMQGNFEPCSYIVKQEAMPYGNKSMQNM